ncbi:MAG: flagellar motor switch phosphatase FliY [Oscillospiraceae bacterium]
MQGMNSADFSDMKKDAIGEIQNITMGSAATALSNLLSAKVWITTPKVEICKISELSFPELEPSIHVKIEYIKGVKGTSLMVLKQSDVQMILNQLMGMPLVITEDFQFDEMNISAICEVMNQMMGASATALAEIIDTPIDISTPEASVSADDADFSKISGSTPDDDICRISFDLTIDGIINSEFITLISIDLANLIADKMLSSYNVGLDSYMETNPAAPQESYIQPTTEAPPVAQPVSQPVPAQPVPQPVSPPPQAAQPVYQAPPVAQPAPYPYPAQPYPQPPFYPPYPEQGYGAYYGAPAAMPPQEYTAPAQDKTPQKFSVKPAQFQSFDQSADNPLSREQIDNLKLLMNVPLSITIEIGSTSRKVEEILEFTQGTVIELERQAGAPVDVIVNGNLIAKGDVVVIDDNFAVRITEIIKSKFLDTLGKV